MAVARSRLGAKGGNAGGVVRPRPTVAPCRGRRLSVSAAAAAEKDPSQRIVITGMGICSVFGNDPDVFYDKLLQGVSGIDFISRFDASEYPTKFGGEIKDFDTEGQEAYGKISLGNNNRNTPGLIDKKSERRYDDCLKYTMVAGKKALQMAGLEKGLNAEAHEALDKTRAGVLVGSGMGGLQVFQDGTKNLVQRGYRKMSPFFIPYAITNMGSALLAIDQGFMGPNYSVSTACATSNYAYVSAANHLRNGEVDVMVVGGSEAPIIPVGLGGFVACRALSSRNDDPQGASRPWDADRDGFVMGEGSGVLVMETLEHAVKRGVQDSILAEYMGGAITCDAYHMTDPRADGLGVSKCIELAIEQAGIEREQVNYINAHATSTLVGDIAEVKAMRQVFTDMSHVKVNATKSMIGHCLGAAGGMEAVATIQAIRTGEVHPTINQHNLIDEVSDINTVPNEKQKHDITAGISNSFGFGGHNSVCVFAPYKA